MPSEYFTGHTLVKIRTIIKKGVDAPLTYRDQRGDGLAVKITRTGASWYYSTREDNRQIAPFNRYTDIHLMDLRHLCSKLRGAKKAGEPLDTLIDTFNNSGSVAEAVAQHDVDHGNGLTWEAGRDLYLEWVRKNKAADTYRSYRSALGCFALAEDFKPIANRPLLSITMQHLAKVRKNITERCYGLKARGKSNGVRQAVLTVMALRSCFGHLSNDPDAWVEGHPNPALNLEKPKETQINSRRPKTRALTQLEIGALLWGLQSEKNEAARLAITIQLLTGQRRYTVVNAKRSEFNLNHPHYDVVWEFGDKTHAFRALPLDGDAGRIVRMAMRLSEKNTESEFLFPKQRRKSKDDDMSGHMNEATMSEVIQALRGPGGSLFDLDFDLGTHDLRKTFTTVMTPKMSNHTFENRQLIGEDIEMITHMNEGREKVSMLVYDKNQYLDIKSVILREWQDWVYGGYTMYEQHLESKKQSPRLAA
jgi:integrase